MMRPFLVLVLLLAPLAVGCGKNLEEQVRDSIRTVDRANLGKKQVEVQSVRTMGDHAVAEVTISTAVRMIKEDGKWQISEVRLGDRHWEPVDHILTLLNQQRRELTETKLGRLVEGIERYRSGLGHSPNVEDFESLIDLLTPRYLEEVIRLDGWSSPFQFQTRESGFQLRSAGADGLFDTEDDLVRDLL